MSDITEFLSDKMKALTPEKWDALMRYLNSRLAALEEQSGIEARVVESILVRGLQVIEDGIGPAIVAATEAAANVQAMADLGLVFSAPSTTTMTINTNQKTLTIAAANRSQFAPAPFMLVTAGDGFLNGFVGRRTSYDRGSGTLVLDVEQTFGSGTFSDWTVGPVATTGHLEALRDAITLDKAAAAESATQAATSAGLAASHAGAAATSASAAAAALSDALVMIRPTSAPASGSSIGRLWYDGSTDVVRVFNGTGWVPAVTASIGGMRFEHGTFGASPTGVVTVGGGFSSVMVFLNGSLLPGSAYAAASPTVTISGVVAGDKYFVWAYKANDATDYYTKEEANALTEGRAIVVDAVQTLTAAAQGRARANMGAEVLAGQRNKIINGGFDFWQRSTAQTVSGYGSDDRWVNFHFGSSKVHARVFFPLGQNDVAGNASSFSRTVITSVAGPSNHVTKAQYIEDVSIFSGKLVTVTFWSRANAPRQMSVELFQHFGTGGAPSASVTGIGVQKFNLTTEWQKFSYTVNIPSVAGKTRGTNNNDYLALCFWLEAGSNFSARTLGLGQQSGTIDLARVSVVEGDATDEDDPFAPLHRGAELALCQRYYCQTIGHARLWASGANQYGTSSVYWPVMMRATPTVTHSGGTQYNAVSGILYDAAPTGARWEVASAGAGDCFFIGRNIFADAEL